MAVDPVLIAGAGPVGLITALSLARQGVPVTVLEAGAALERHSRAATFHSPTLDIFDQLRLMEPLLEIGYQIGTMRIADAGLNEVVELPFEVLRREGITDFPYDFCVSQGVVSQVAFDAASVQPNLQVLMDHEVRDVHQSADQVIVDCATSTGAKQFRAPWLIAADGAGSVVRKSLQIPFEGFTWTDRFLIIETHVDMTDLYGFVTFIANGPDWRLSLKIPDGPGVDDWSTRVLSSVPDHMSDAEATDPARMERILQDLKPRPEQYPVTSTTIYSVHQRVAETFRLGRVLLAGDAAHVNSPLGAMGLNSGIHDGINAARKLAQVANGSAGDELLDVYNRQRRSTTIDFIQKRSIENKRRQEETDLAKRRLAIDTFKQLATTEAGLLAFSKSWQMYDSLEYEQKIS